MIEISSLGYIPFLEVVSLRPSDSGKRVMELHRAVSANSPEIKIRSRSRPPILINQECAQAESREVDRLRD